MSSTGGALRVVVTGPTGDIGRSFLERLDAAPEVASIVGMARRPFDPAGKGLTKVEYRRGDVTERGSVEQLVAGADVVVHLAFVIIGSHDHARAINVEGSRNIFEAAFEAKVPRLVYTSSVAAYGFHDDHPPRLTEDHPARGSDSHHYSAQKAEVERMLELMGKSFPSTDVYVVRPCIVAGPTALSLIEEIPYVQMRDLLPEPAKKIASAVPLLRPVLPDPGTPFQLVHEDDVADALVTCTLGAGAPGIYNLAGDGEITIADLARALGWYALPVPDLLVEGAAKIVTRLPYLPPAARWVDAIRVPTLVDTSKARAALGWEPRYDAHQTLAATVHGARRAGIIPSPERAPLR